MSVSRAGWLSVAIMLVTGMSLQADDRAVNGYTYIAPSAYLTPPVVVYDPAFQVPVGTFVQPLGYYAPAPMVYAEPAFVTQTVVPYNPTWAYAPVVAYPPVRVGPTAVREKAWVSRNGLEYKYREYVPGRAAPVYSYRIDSERHGVRIRERVR